MLGFFMFFAFCGLQAQTTIIDPAQEGGFNLGNTFASNGWSVSNGPNNPWVIGNAVTTAPIAGNSAYISNTGGATHNYDLTKNAENFFWRDVTVPAGETRIKLTFDWLTTGESTKDAFYVFAVPTSVTPVGSDVYPGTGNGPTPTLPSSYSVFIGGHTATTVQSQTIFLPASYAGTTFRLVFYWKNNNDNAGNQPPGLVDNISLKSQVPMTFTSVQSGNTKDPATWGQTVEYPGTVDNIIISTEHTVSINGNSTEYVGSVTVNGTLDFLYLASPGVVVSSYYIGGDVTVNSGGLFNGFHLNVTPTFKTIYIAGNITNNGRFDMSGGGIMNLNGNTVQTVSGTGIYGGTVTSTVSTTNRAGVINSLSITNTSSAIPNINWQVNNIRVGTLSLSSSTTLAKVNLNGNKIILGNYTSGTLTAAVGSGLMNGTLARWWTTGSTGTAITTATIPFAEPTNSTSRYPFINSTGVDRSMYITRSTSSTSGNTAGELAVVYADASTITTGLSIADGAYTINNRFDGNWTITKDATYVYASGTHAVTVVAPSSLFPSVPKTRLMLAAAPIAPTTGTHFDGNVKPVALKTTMTTADITSGAIYLGIASADQANTSIASGNWDATTTWSKGTAPVCGEAVTMTYCCSQFIRSGFG
jgi:hypothetical protein